MPLARCHSSERSTLVRCSLRPLLLSRPWPCTSESDNPGKTGENPLILLGLALILIDSSSSRGPDASL